MFRQPLPCTLAVVALGFGLCVAPASVSGQERSTYQRLDRLERDLNMLQRQVYRGMPAPPPGHNALVNTEIRMDRLEAQMRDLTGRVEELTNEIAQVRRRIGQANADVDSGDGPGAGASRPLASANTADGPGSAGRLGPPPAYAGEGDAPPPPTGDAPTPIFRTLTPPGMAPGPESSPPGPAGSVASAGHVLGARAPHGSASAQYNHAFGLLKRADYAAAETALKAFVAQHPKDRMAGNAQYWLGETYYARHRWLDAASAFAEGYKRYPKSGKAADGLLKLGMALSRAKQKQNACVALAQLDRDFPHASAAVKQHAAREKKRLGC